MTVKIGERITKVEERVSNLTTVVMGLKEMLNPKVERWNKTYNDMIWVKRIVIAFLVGIASAFGYQIAITVL